MNEVRALTEAFETASSNGEGAALATVVRVEGSAYRRPGARMLVTDSGRTTGVISGGCLDGDVRERAARVIRTGRPVLVRYDTTTDEDLVWGLGLGCNGVVEVLIEAATDRTHDLIRFLDESSRGHGRSGLATVIRSDARDVPLGARVLLSSDGWASVLPETHAIQTIAPDIVPDLQAAVQTGVSSVMPYGANAEFEAFVEAIEPQVPLVILGAGADAVPLAAVARHFGWHTTVVDTHARERSLDRFKDADAVILSRPEDVATRVTLTRSSVVVLMTHNYTHDSQLLPVLLNSPARYIGCLGPRRRTQRLLSELQGEPEPGQDRLSGRLHAPIGLDLGAESPSEIAMSIGAEILAVIKRRSGGFLRDCLGSIHGAPQRHTVEDLPVVADAPSGTDVPCPAVSA
jgi:xanthine/CO dehydrogenase XdhC/CoxF family maturation factor